MIDSNADNKIDVTLISTSHVRAGDLGPAHRRLADALSLYFGPCDMVSDNTQIIMELPHIVAHFKPSWGNIDCTWQR